MNIIYLLTNTSKTEGKRFYIGSKSEANIRDINQIPTIVSLKNDKPYYSSSQSQEFKTDFLKGDVFSASILEQNIKREKLLERESFYINKFNAVKSADYYNMSDAKLNCYDQTAITNIYGETIQEYAKNESNSSKREARAKALGFNNYGELAFHIYNKSLQGETFTKISTDLKMERHFASRYLVNWDMKKATKELLSYTDGTQLRQYIINGASLKKAAQLVGIEEPVAKMLIGDFAKLSTFSVAQKKGLTEEELGKLITIDILSDMGFVKCAQKHGITTISAQRYFLRYIQKRLKISDL